MSSVALVALTALAIPQVAGVAAPKGQPAVPTVAIAAPTEQAPAEVPTGGPFSLTFSSDRAGDYAIAYRPAGSTAGFTAFPGGTGAALKGTTTVGLTAPATDDRYDLRVSVTLGTRTGEDTEVAALHVGTRARPASVTITSPTTTTPATATEGATFALTLTTDEPGSYVLSHRGAGADAYTAFGDPAATGSIDAGETTVDLTAPAPDGTYDLRLDFVDLDSRPSNAEQQDALRVVEPVQPHPADVALTEPTSASPAIVSQGGLYRVAFTTDQAGTYAVERRSADPLAASGWTPAAPGANGVAGTPGTVSLTLAAPATPGTFDLRVTFVNAAGMTSTSTVESSALVVLLPGVTEAERCDPIDPAHCLLPFPNDHFTAADPTTATGRRVNLNVLSMPRNVAGKPVMPTEWNRQDGFSPGTPVLARVPELDLHATWGTADRAHAGAIDEQGSFDHRDHITDIDLYLQPDAPIVIVNARTGERHPFWSELDTHPDTSEERRLLIARPARNFAEGERYIVALRDLKRADGSNIAASAAFRSYRDRTAPLTDPRRLEMEALFAQLATAGIARDDLYLAWDFTIASERNLSERVLHMRDEAFAALGDTTMADEVVQGEAPEFVIDRISSLRSADVDGGVNYGAYRRVQGRVQVPNYLDHPQQVRGGTATPTPATSVSNEGASGSRLYYEPFEDELPDVNPAQPTVWATFTCDVPLDRGPSYVTLEGHGLLGTQGQVGDGRWPRRHGFAICAADWWGMSTEDVPNVASILADFSNFSTLPDRAQQGFLNFLFLGRAAVHSDGFASHPAFQQNADGLSAGSSLLRTDDGTGTDMSYDGNSQGGIMGGSLVAISPDIDRGILGVTGMNYSTLLQRSIDWEGLYAIPFYANYRDPVERQLVFALMQMLWDRGEANGYAQHMTTDPLANTPPHEVMLQVAFSDHQVSNHAAEVEARTIGAPIMVPGLDTGRHWERTPYQAGSATYPHQGSALIYWDSGNAPPPNGNLPPGEGSDPHGHARRDVAGGWQEAHFLLSGEMVDVCGGNPYFTVQHPSPLTCTAPTVAP